MNIYIVNIIISSIFIGTLRHTIKFLAINKNKEKIAIQIGSANSSITQYFKTLWLKTDIYMVEPRLSNVYYY